MFGQFNNRRNHCHDREDHRRPNKCYEDRYDDYDDKYDRYDRYDKFDKCDDNHDDWRGKRERHCPPFKCFCCTPCRPKPCRKFEPCNSYPESHHDHKDRDKMICFCCFK